MEVRLPNGAVMKNVPEGTSKEAIMEKAIRGGLATAEDFGAKAPSPTLSSEGIMSGLPTAMKQVEKEILTAPEVPVQTTQGYGATRPVETVAPTGATSGYNKMADATAQQQGNVYIATKLREAEPYMKEASALIAANPSEYEGKSVLDVATDIGQIERAKGAANTALMFFPGGAGLRGMAMAGAKVGGASGALDVGADVAKGKDVSVKDSLSTVAGGAAIGGATGGLLGGATRLAGTIVDKLKRGIVADEEAVKIARANGIDLTLGEVADSAAIRALEGVVTSGLGGGKLQKAKETAIQKGGELAKDFTKEAQQTAVVQRKVSDTSDIGEATSAFEAVRTMGDSTLRKNLAETFKEAVPNAFGKMRDEISRGYNEKIGSLDEMARYAKITRIKTPTVSKKVDEILTNADKFNGLSPKMIKKFENYKNLKLTSFSDLDGLKRELSDQASKAYKKGDTGLYRKYNDLNKAVKADADKFANALGSDAKSVYGELDEQYTAMNELMRSPLLQQLSKKEFGEDVWKTLKTGDASEAKMRKFLSTIKKGGSGLIQRSLEAQYLDDAYKTAMKGDEFSPKGYAKFLEDNKDFYKQFATQPEAVDGLETLMKSLAKTEKTLETTKNPWVALVGQSAPALLGAGGGYASSGTAEGAFTGFLTGVGGRKLASMGSTGIGKWAAKNSKTLTDLELAKKAGDKVKMDAALSILTKALLTQEVMPDNQ